MKSKALCDFQKHEDIAGDGEEMAGLLANMWSFHREVFSGLDVGDMKAHVNSLDRAFASAALILPRSVFKCL